LLLYIWVRQYNDIYDDVFDIIIMNNDTEDDDDDDNILKTGRPSIGTYICLYHARLRYKGDRRLFTTEEIDWGRRVIAASIRKVIRGKYTRSHSRQVYEKSPRQVYEKSWRQVFEKSSRQVRERTSHLESTLLPHCDINR